MLSHLLSRLKYKKHEWIHLDEEFPLHAKQRPEYANDIHGLELKEKNAHKLLEDFSAEQNSHMMLHIPSESYEEFREYRLEKVKKNVLHVMNVSTDTECENFIRTYSPVRFSFRFQHFLFFFETDVLGIFEKDSNIYLVEKPVIIHQEHRSHQRYRLWPEYKVYFNEMHVADISQKGISFHSSYNFKNENTIENAELIFPAVYCNSEEECYFEGNTITVPKTVIANCIKEKSGFRYGGYFASQWPDEAIKSMNDFFLAVRKRQREVDE
ncbi:MAG: hypothetical protein ACQERT_11895 [Thermodesulfobacteriota bacterium]